MEIGKLIQLAVEEVLTGPISAQKALNMGNGEIKFATNLEAVVDAKGVFTSIENDDTKVPAESSLLSSVQAVREALVEKRLRTLYWVDTRDMVSDGLTKGSVDRAEIILLYEKNLWKSIGDKPASVSLYQAGAQYSGVAGAHYSGGLLKFNNGIVYLDWLTITIG